MKDFTFSIEKFSDFSVEIVNTIRQLVKQIGENYSLLTDEDIQEMLVSPNTTILLAKKDNGEIIGMATLLIYRIPYIRKAYVDDLVVDSLHRGNGIAHALMEEAIRLAKEKKAAFIDLTAKPSRGSGNRLYEHFGFEKRDTNAYRLRLSYEQV